MLFNEASDNTMAQEVKITKIRWIVKVKEVKIKVVGEASPWESVPQYTGS